MNDLISRKDAITAIFNEITTRRFNGDEPMDEYKAEAILTNIKPAEQRTGRWIECYNQWYDLVVGYKCSECSEFYGSKSKFNYCPNCGAKIKNE